MYKGYLIESLPASFASNYSQRGRELTEGRRSRVTQDLGAYSGKGGALDAGRIAEAWFPEIKADVFISHSHLDKDLAISLVGWLKHEFGLTAFVDSLVWGSADALLREIDNKECKSKDGKAYDYEKRNLSTSHVHMMLAIAIGQMIDKCECLFFLSTPSSVSAEKTINDEAHTSSPWLFAEIGLSRFIRRRPLSRERDRRLAEAAATRGSVTMDSINIDHTLPLSHLSRINQSVLKQWRRRSAGKQGEHALDVLYDLK